MNCRRIDLAFVVPRVARPQQQTQQQSARVPAARASRDITGRPVTVSGMCYNSADRRQINRVVDGSRTQPEVDAHRSSGFAYERNGCRQQRALYSEKRPPRSRNNASVPNPVENRRNFSRRLGEKELPVNADGRDGRQRTGCDRTPASGEMLQTPRKPDARSRVFRNAEVEISGRRPASPKHGETSAAAENDGGSVSWFDCAASLSLPDSARTSTASCNGDGDVTNSNDDVTQVRGRSTRTSGVFSRMSTEAQLAWNAVKHARMSAAAASSDAGPETESSAAHSGDATSGLDCGQPTASGRVRSRDQRRRRAKYATEETAYDVFEPGSSRVAGRPVNGASTHQAVTINQQRAGRRHNDDRRAVGNFRITSAAYDSRLEDMVAAAAEARRATQNYTTGDVGEDDDDVDDDAEFRAESVAKCLLWLRRQQCH